MSVQALESALIARLQSGLSGQVQRIYSAAEIAQVQEQAQLSPAVSVLYDGMRPITDLANGSIQQIAFRFLVVAIARNATQTQVSAGARADGSGLLDAILESLLGFRPAAGCSGLELQQAPPAIFTQAGFAYYPLAFETRRTYRGKP